MRPAAFGYFSLAHDDETEVERLHNELAAYASMEGFGLVEIFVDHNMLPGNLLRPGFETLLAGLKDHDGAYVLVPTPNHLSPSEMVRSAIVATLSEFGRNVLVVPG
ncbi:hypothetical protein FDG2_1569 [Candidatus Protofrankia californiensis]|uniref:Resolvase/invertase-type recombinase catalytic domain-containing protein n=1 Tax=Candidatus Protofrankia californiensis TaxID=1839754 RepID=A0A1C3NVZ2_9ACTN|nr:hypothetical protein FDG2_1569 [Candidatus Protofrankia californiensis]